MSRRQRQVSQARPLNHYYLNTFRKFACWCDRLLTYGVLRFCIEVGERIWTERGRWGRGEKERTIDLSPSHRALRSSLVARHYSTSWTSMEECLTVSGAETWSYTLSLPSPSPSRRQWRSSLTVFGDPGSLGKRSFSQSCAIMIM